MDSDTEQEDDDRNVARSVDSQVTVIDPDDDEAPEKVVGSGKRNLMVKNVEVHRTTRLWKSTTMVRKSTRHICRFLLATQFSIARMAQTCAREGKRVRDNRDTEAIDENYHVRGIGNQIVHSIHETWCSCVD